MAHPDISMKISVIILSNVQLTPLAGIAYVITIIACASLPILENSILDASTWKISFRGRTRMRSNSPLLITEEKVSNPRAKHSARENAINTTAKQRRISAKVNPSTCLKRPSKKQMLRNAKKEVRNCPATVRKNEVLYCI